MSKVTKNDFSIREKGIASIDWAKVEEIDLGQKTTSALSKEEYAKIRNLVYLLTLRSAVILRSVFCDEESLILPID